MFVLLYVFGGSVVFLGLVTIFSAFMMNKDKSAQPRPVKPRLLGGLFLTVIGGAFIAWVYGVTRMGA